MAYMSQEKKKELEPAIKACLKKFGMKGSVSVDGGRGLTVTLKSGPIDFKEDLITARQQRNCGPSPFEQTEDQVRSMKYFDINVYWYKEHFAGTKALEFLDELIPLMNIGNWDRSDIQSDYFDVGWYVYVKIGKWNNPYEVIK